MEVKFDQLPELSDNSKIDVLLAAWLRGESGPNLGTQLNSSLDTILTRIEFHGIAGLLHKIFQDKFTLPDKLATDLRDRAISLAFWEASHARLLMRLLPALNAQGITPLLFKGTALSYSYYEDPATRARGDSDMLVAWKDYNRAGDILVDMGLAPPVDARADNVTIENTFIYAGAVGFNHYIDLHGKIFDSVLLSRLFTFEELLERSIELPKLAPGARALGAVDALLIACIHRLVHLQNYYFVNDIAYRSADRLIWLQDIHLLAAGFSSRDWKSFQTLAAKKGLCVTCADGLLATQSAFASKLPEGMIESLSAARGEEKLARYFRASQFLRHLMNMWAIESFGDKIRFLTGLAFPPAQFVRERFGEVRLSWMPWLYVRYLFSGIYKSGSGRPGGK